MFNKLNSVTPSPPYPLTPSRRRASVLILVVALLVLLALIGTAYISSTRIERYSSNQNSANTQIDLLIDSLKTLTITSVVDKLYDPATGTFRLPSNAIAQSSYTPYDSPQSDLYLGSRVPEMNTAVNAVIWPGFSWPLVTAVDGSYTFQSPVDKSSGMTSSGKSTVIAIPYSKNVNGQNYPSLIYYLPTGKPVTMADGTTATGPAYLSNSSGGWILAGGNPSLASIAFLAGDADGDGIADSPLWPLPIGPINGITYYAAVRIIDQNSAVNASTAWSSQFDFDPAAYVYGPQVGTTPPTGASAQFVGLFRSNVGLRELLTSTSADSEIQLLNKYRFNDTMATAYATPIADALPPATTSPTPRTDFTFLTEGDAMENQLVQRPNNRGYNSNVAMTTANQYQWLSTDTIAALAHGFCIRSTSLGTTELENDLITELVNLSPTTPYSASQYGTTGAANTWFGANFDYNSVTTPQPQMPLRALLVSSNPVSNSVSGHYNYKGLWATGTQYHVGDWVYINRPAPPNPANTPSYRFVCIQDHIAATGTNDPTEPMATETWTAPEGHVASDMFWAYVPWTTTPTKISTKTGSFGALMAAYWNVFWDHPSASAVAGAFPQPLTGHPFLGGDTTHPANQIANQNVPGGSVTPYPARMFRSPIRDPNNAAVTTGATYSALIPANLQYLTPSQMMILRSSLAALNTVSLRRATGSTAGSASGLDDVISRQISIPVDPADAASKAYNVMLFGATKQPYISEVYVEVDAANLITGIAIELSNPYGTAMTLTDWHIAWMDRSTAAKYSTTTTLNMALANGVPIPTGTTIPAATTTGPGRLIITDGVGAGPWPSSSSANNVLAITPANTLATVASATNSELIIMRPRSATAGPAALADSVNTYNEGTAVAPTYCELVPVDQIDLGALNGGTNPAYDYRRATTTAGAAWNFVYPGVYSLVPATAPYRHVGFVPVTPAAIPTSLGADKPLNDPASPNNPANATYPTVPIQIANIDSGGWNQPGAGVNSTPFGAFGRNGDLLQVPFIGAYRILPATTAAPFTNATTLVELNSLPMDSAFADDQDAGDDMAPAEATAAAPPATMREQIGRFCPVGDPGDTTLPRPPTFDFLPSAVSGTVPYSNDLWRYQWAGKLFDFLTVQAPTDDYFPNADPLTYPAVAPVAVRNQTNTNIINGQTPGFSEDTVPLEGLVNINTAPWPVLAALPWFPDGYTQTAYPAYTSTPLLTQALAQAIVSYRNANGPFHSITDLYKVSASVTVPASSGTATTVTFKQLADDLNTYAVSGGHAVAAGDFSPYNGGAGGADGANYDFEKRFLLINRVSNLITTRSDAFTCYLLLQGWSGAGTANPTLVAQRRIAFVLDRSPSTALPGGAKYQLINVPQN